MAILLCVSREYLVLHIAEGVFPLFIFWHRSDSLVASVSASEPSVDSLSQEHAASHKSSLLIGSP